MALSASCTFLPAFWKADTTLRMACTAVGERGGPASPGKPAGRAAPAQKSSTVQQAQNRQFNRHRMGASFSGHQRLYTGSSAGKLRYFVQYMKPNVAADRDSLRFLTKALHRMLAAQGNAQLSGGW